MTQKCLNEIKTSINNLETDLKTTKRSSDPNDHYLELIESFSKEAQTLYETLELMFKKMSEAYKDLGDYFAFDTSKYPLGEFFTDLRTFGVQFQQCVDENRKMRETEEKIRRAEEDRAAREKEREARKTTKEKIMMQSSSGASALSGKPGANDADTGVMDNLYLAILLSYL